MPTLVKTGKICTEKEEENMRRPGELHFLGYLSQ